MSRQDDETGFLTVPARYMTESGREKIDLIRDMVTDREFATYCFLTALKYEGRDKSPDDPEKRRWYLEMMDHVLGMGTPDPRSERTDFKAYVRQPSDRHGANSANSADEPAYFSWSVGTRLIGVDCDPERMCEVTRATRETERPRIGVEYDDALGGTCTTHPCHFTKADPQ